MATQVGLRIQHVSRRLAEWVAFLHATVIATVVMCRVRNPTCTARERPRIINGRSIKKCLHILFGYIRHSKDRINTKNTWRLLPLPPFTRTQLSDFTCIHVNAILQYCTFFTAAFPTTISASKTTSPPSKATTFSTNSATKTTVSGTTTASFISKSKIKKNH